VQVLYLDVAPGAARDALLQLGAATAQHFNGRLNNNYSHFFLQVLYLDVTPGAARDALLQLGAAAGLTSPTFSAVPPPIPL
jgi:hypothetical protein